MYLKEVVNKILKERNRSLSWLAMEMGKTFDGLKLGLTRGSIKYTDLKRMADILEIPVSGFFEGGLDYGGETQKNILFEEEPPYLSMKKELNSCKELTNMLKSQLKDKDKIIELLSKTNQI
ncbi:MAG: hypothetical protein ACYCZO_14330 [Daejeonella sp.]